jgi:hypothetical protein
MVRNLILGHLDIDWLRKRQIVALRTLDFELVRLLFDEMCDRDSEGRDTFNGMPVDYKDGCVIARWMVGSFRNHKAEEFAVRLHRQTGCVITDGERLLDPEEFLSTTLPTGTPAKSDSS